MSKNYKDINAKVNIESETSIFSFYKKLIQLRRENKMMAYGSFEAILEDDENIFSYIRRYKLNNGWWYAILQTGKYLLACL